MQNLIDLDQEDNSGMKLPSLNEIKRLPLDEKIELVLNKCLDVMSFNEKLQSNLSRCEKIIGDLVKDVSVLHEENSYLKNQIATLSTHTNHDLKYERLKQAMKHDEIEIWGVEEKSDENIINTVMRIAEDFKVNLTPDDIMFANRRKLSNKAGHNVPRTIRVKFYNRMKRDQLVQAGKHTKLPRSENVDGKNGRNFIYINEALTKHMEYIYGMTRELRRKNCISKTWCKKGKVFVQRGNEPPKLIESVDDLNGYN